MDTDGYKAVDNIREAVSEQLSSLYSAGVVDGFNIDCCDTRHNRKSVWGRFIDWIKWKSPLKRFFYKPVYVEANLADILYRRWEAGGMDSLDEDGIDDICGWVYGITVWEEKYPVDPYAVMDIKFSLKPVVPANYIKMDITLDEEE